MWQVCESAIKKNNARFCSPEIQRGETRKGSNRAVRIGTDEQRVFDMRAGIDIEVAVAAVFEVKSLYFFQFWRAFLRGVLLGCIVQGLVG